jgi:glutamate--cysteine ligase catalytic subunit
MEIKTKISILFLGFRVFCLDFLGILYFKVIFLIKIKINYTKTLVDGGVDKLMAQHISHLFVRDPLVLYRENLDAGGAFDDTDLWENIQSTNWQSMRFKPPPSVDSGSPDIGWRVEFRTTELQITDFENAALVAFLVLLTRAILTFDLHLVMPISKVDENMRRAQVRDACVRERFYFRRNVFDRTDPTCVELSVDEIVNGQQGDNNNGFPGLVPLVKQYVGQLDTVDVQTNCKIMQYLKLIERRASGALKTTANWMRSFVMNSSKYGADSVVSDELAYELMLTMSKIGQGLVRASDLNDCIST